MEHRPFIGRAATKACAALLALTLASACEAPPTDLDQDAVDIPPPSFSHGPFTTSSGIYRIPYIDGSGVSVYNDHHDHNPPNRIDMGGDAANYQIVAAASGYIRAIVDWHGNSGGLGDGLAADSSGPQFNGGDDSLEHSCQDALDMNGNRIPNSVVVGLCQQYNNYVWIEHANGEWTKYTHFQTGSVTANNWSVGDWINAGEVLGIEGDVGAATGRHLHFEVGVPTDSSDLTPFSRLGGFMVSNFGVNVVPRVCDADNTDYLYATGAGLTANPCDNAPPVASVGGPYEIDEGSTVVLDGSGSSDPDGRPLTFVWSPSDGLDNPWAGAPTYTGEDDAVVNFMMHVYDQVESLTDSAETTVTVNNVAPTVTIDASQVTETDEGGSILVKADFTDPGVLDAPFTGQIQCYAVPDDTLTVDAGINVTSTDGPLTGTASAYCPFGDTSESGDPPTGTFHITVTVTDKDGATGEAGFDVTVHDLAPEPEFDIGGATNINGEPTFIATIGEAVDFWADITDEGSDDVYLNWDWDDGSADQATFLLDPPGTDPFPSPNESPRDLSDSQSHAWTDACFYAVSLTASDDDGGEASAGANVVIAGNSGRARSHGYWQRQYSGKDSNDFDSETLGCYLAIVEHMSAVFDEERSGTGSFGEAVEILHTGGSKGDIAEELDQQLMAAWLNFANGAFGWTDLVDTTGHGGPDTPFATAITTAESVRLDAGATTDELVAQKDILEAINVEHGNSGS